ncbi:hypothetical protein HZF05_11240 [Sphingomonas sp. CGMCC 1.13654]|uniref:Uncharacterized protein n=1 Tax=Sphingomonas chungangi TaxID=2683589 RepID=A0A838L808_9SPHN|nr:hypothetical protein [Sphingomonas chungangi]MBA2934669.1 hypothetical protein [Sphingomonas chungangi]MVW57980.1 hypothetical protein [Sphingomonas chungangi]
MITVLGLLMAMWGLPIAAGAMLAAPCLVSGGYRAYMRRQLVGDPKAA